MRELFFSSDHHFGDASSLKYRPQFSSIEEMDENFIERWNKTVPKNGHVIHVGDFAVSVAAAKAIRPRLNGVIDLVVGNHDRIIPLANSGLFSEMSMWRVMRMHKMVITHLPLIRSENKFKLLNVHGHTHWEGSPDPSYQVSVCVERTNWRPVSVDEVKLLALQR